MMKSINDSGDSNLKTIGNRGRKKGSRIIAFLPLIVALVALLFSLWNSYTIRKAIDGLEWEDAVASDKARRNNITPDVGTIQFLNRGYSITLEEVSYNANGLYLSGYIGNPTNLWISNLTIEFTAHKPFYLFRETFMKASSDSIERFLPTAEKIGTAQTKPISVLRPGRREQFDVTIPNVKQTKDTIEIGVVFTGERYSYEY